MIHLTVSCKTALKDCVGDCVSCIEPGHGLKGKQKWSLGDDVSEVYAMHKKKCEAICFSRLSC